MVCVHTYCVWCVEGRSRTDTQLDRGGSPTGKGRNIYIYRVGGGANFVFVLWVVEDFKCSY